MNKIYVLLILGLLSLSSVFGQTSSITGHISDKNERNLAGGTIRILTDKDSVLTSTSTKEKGRCEIKIIPQGTYALELSYLGYQKERHAIEVEKSPLTVSYQ